MASQEQQTHINDLPDLCLQAILSRVGKAALPLRAAPCGRMEIAHPLQCAVVCRQWHSNAYMAVTSLAFRCMKVTERHLQELRRFTSLTHLTFIYCHLVAPDGFEAAAALLAESTRGLQSLELSPDVHDYEEDDEDEIYFWCMGSLSNDTWTAALARALPSWKHLCKLDVGNLHLEEDRKGFRLLFTNLGTLPELESLTFTISQEFIGPDELHSSPILQQLQPLVRLKELNVSCYVVPTSSMIPTSALKTLQLIWVEEPENFESLGDLPQLRHLRLVNCDSLTSLPPSLTKLSQLRHLYLQGCDSLTSLGPSLTQLFKLESLEVWHCLSLTTLSEGPCSLPLLTRINIMSCPFLSALPTDFKRLQNLASLKLMRCVSLKTIVPLEGLQALKQLHIFNCPLRRLPAGVGQLAKLTVLDISFCPWEKLPQTIGIASSLLELDMTGCTSLIQLPNQLANLVRLQILRLGCCMALKRLPRDLGNLQSLKELDISGCQSLQALPVSLHRITGLQKLFLAEIRPEVALQRGVGAFLRLEELSLEASNSQQSWLPSSLSQLSGLESLYVGGKFLRQQSTLRTMMPVFSGPAPPMQTLQALPKLRRLELHNSAEILSDTLLRLTALRKLKWKTYFNSWSASEEIVRSLHARGVNVTRVGIDTEE